MAKRVQGEKFYACRRKVRHVSQRMADRAAGEQSRRYRVPLTSYRCAVCKGWHLTKMKWWR